jgi:GntR family transcriptional regulator, hexuronate regulon transcriptional repressor
LPNKAIRKQQTEQSRLYQQIADRMTAAIRRGTYRRGQRMPSERDLAEQYGVSRPTIREAIIALEISGLVEVRQGSGVYVTHWTKDNTAREERLIPQLDIGAFELMEARRLIEGETAALAATAITGEQLKTLGELFTIMANKNAPNEEVDRVDRQFHITIAQATQNSALVTVVEYLWDLRYSSPLCRAILSRAAIARPVAREHLAILQALKTRDPQLARETMRSHLEEVIDALLKATEIDSVARVKSEVAAKRSALAKRSQI